MRLAIDDATSMDAAAILLVTKKIVPSSPSGRLNLRWKKYVIQDLVESGTSSAKNDYMTYRDANPEAKESNPNRMNSRMTSDHRSFSMDANKPFFLGGSVC